MNGAILDKAQITRHPKTGRIRRASGTFSLPVGDTAQDSVKSFLFANADELGLSMKDSDLKTVQDVATPTGRVIRFQQLQDGIPIFGTEILVTLDNASRLRQIDLEHVPAGQIVRPVGDQKPMAAQDAAKVAQDTLGEVKLRQSMKTPDMIYFPTSDGLRLAYEVYVLTAEPAHDWRFIVDAYTGEVLSKEDLIFEVNGQGLVFDPNPVVTAGNNTYRDPTAIMATCSFNGTPQVIIDNERVTRTLRDITFAGGTYKLEGPYVKVSDKFAPNDSPPEETSANNFNYSSGDAQHRFEAVMAYYHIDTLQRYIQDTLGITNANNRQTEADFIDNSGGLGHGAYYSPSTKDLHFGDSGNCIPDRAEEADCIYHEYGHAIQDNQVPGWGGVNPMTGRNEARAIGEGFGDILACVYFAPEHPYQREVFEDWVFAPAGLRRVDGTKVYPTDWQSEEHDDGEIWSAALWNIYRMIGGDSPVLATRQAARDELLKTVIGSHFHLLRTASMSEAAEAVMNESAELPGYWLQHGIEMINSFHDRGLLLCQTGSDLKLVDLWSQQTETDPPLGWQQVEYGQDNWFYATVRNDGTVPVRAAVVTFNFQCPYVTPVYPSDWRDEIISAAVIWNLAPGASITVRARFPQERIPAIPAGATQLHGCILAEVYNPVDHVPAGCTSLYGGNGKLYQRNTDVVDALPDTTLDYQLVISNYHIQHEQLVQLEVIRPQQYENVEVWFGHRDPHVIEGLWERAGKLEAMVMHPAVEASSVATGIRILEPTRIMVGPIGDAPGLVLNLAQGSSLAVLTNEAQEGLQRATVGMGLIRRKAELVKEAGQPSLKLFPGHVAGFPYIMQPRERVTLDVHFKVPAEARPGDQLKYEVVQRNDKGERIGGFDVLVNVVAR